jgi:RsiW-degrading membrane proteinase PrsW (M82 family)
MSGSSAVIAFLEKLASVFSSVSGIGFWLFLVGFTLILLIAAAFLVRVLVNLIKLIPNMTTSQFLRFILAAGIILVVVGLFIP